MAGVGPPPAGPECLVQAVLMEVLVILVSSGDKQADRAVVEAVWELLHEFDAMCRLLANVRSPCLPLAKASMQLLTKMHNSKRFSVGPRSVLQVRLALLLSLAILLSRLVYYPPPPVGAQPVLNRISPWIAS